MGHTQCAAGCAVVPRRHCICASRACKHSCQYATTSTSHRGGVFLFFSRHCDDIHARLFATEGERARVGEQSPWQAHTRVVPVDVLATLPLGAHPRVFAFDLCNNHNSYSYSYNSSNNSSYSYNSSNSSYSYSSSSNKTTRW